MVRTAWDASVAIHHEVAILEIAEAAARSFERQADRTDRAIALLRDDHVRDPLARFVALPPALITLLKALVALVRTLPGLGALLIVLVAVYEHDHVGVLLDRAGLAQVGQLRTLVLALLDRARQLRQCQHGDVQLLGDRLQGLRDLGDLLDTIALPRAAHRPDQLEIVDDQERQTVAPLETARARAQGRDRERRSVIDEQRPLGQVLARLDHLVVIGVAQTSAARAVSVP